MKIYTRKGDDGTTGLLYGGRVAKQSVWPSAYGTVDEAQALLGVARACTEPGGELDELLISLERDLWVLMSELATDPANRSKLVAGKSVVTAEMVVALEGHIDSLSERFDPPTEFVVPGQSILAAHLDVARTVVRRAERDVLAAFAQSSSQRAVSTAAGGDEPTQCVAYLNRLSDLVWTLARWQEGTTLTARSAE